MKSLMYFVTVRISEHLRLKDPHLTQVPHKDFLSIAGQKKIEYKFCRCYLTFNNLSSRRRRRGSRPCCGVVVAWRWSRDLNRLSQFLVHIIKTVGSYDLLRINDFLQYVSPAMSCYHVQGVSCLSPKVTRDRLQPKQQILVVWEHTPFNLSQ